MDLPEDVLCLIRDSSRPLTRSDWRTCKRTESGIVQRLNHNTNRFFDNLYQVRPELYAMMSEFYPMIPQWPLDHRIRLIRKIMSIDTQ
jgi:hypothetical protein